MIESRIVTLRPILQRKPIDAVHNMRARLDDAAIGDETALDGRSVKTSGRQKPRPGINRCRRSSEFIGGVRPSELQIRFEERADRTDVFPVAVEEMQLHFVCVDRGGKDFLTKISMMAIA